MKIFARAPRFILHHLSTAADVAILPVLEDVLRSESHRLPRSLLGSSGQSQIGGPVQKEG